MYKDVLLFLRLLCHLETSKNEQWKSLSGNQVDLGTRCCFYPAMIASPLTKIFEKCGSMEIGL